MACVVIKTVNVSAAGASAADTGKSMPDSERSTFTSEE